MDSWKVVPQRHDIRPLQGLTKAAVVLTALIIVGHVVQLLLVQAFTDVGDPTLSNSLRQLAITGPYTLLGLAQLLVALYWMQRASANVTAFGMKDRRWGPGWAVGAWFIPVAHFVLPLFAMLEIWKGSRPDATAATWKRLPFPPLLGWLWGSWVTSLAGTYATGIWAVIQASLGRTSEPVSLPVSLVQWLIYAAAGVLFIMYMRRVAAMQAARVGGQPAPPA